MEIALTISFVCKNDTKMTTQQADDCPFAFAVVYDWQAQSPVDVRQTFTRPPLSPRRKNQQQSMKRRLVLDDSFSQWLGDATWGEFHESFKASSRHNVLSGIPMRATSGAGLLSDTRSLHSRSLHSSAPNTPQAKLNGPSSLHSRSWHAMRTCFTEPVSPRDEAPRLPRRHREAAKRSASDNLEISPASTRKCKRYQRSIGIVDNLSVQIRLLDEKHKVHTETDTDHSTRSAPSESRSHIMLPRGSSRGGRTTGLSNSLRCERTLLNSLHSSTNSRIRRPGRCSMGSSLDPLLHDKCKRFKIVF